MTRLSSVLEASVAVAVAVASVLVSVAGAASAAGAEPPSCNYGVMSVPSLPTMAMISFTLAASPSLTPIYNKVPAS